MGTVPVIFPASISIAAVSFLLRPTQAVPGRITGTVPVIPAVGPVGIVRAADSRPYGFRRQYVGRGQCPHRPGSVVRRVSRADEDIGPYGWTPLESAVRNPSFFLDVSRILCPILSYITHKYTVLLQVFRYFLKFYLFNKFRQGSL